MMRDNVGIFLRGIFVFTLMGILFSSSFVLAQEKVQTYSGFNRFTDNVKLFFFSGDNKVNLALEIREKEINSALDNLDNYKETIKNLERAREKLLIVQEKVSSNNAEKVEANVNEVIDKVNDYENLPEEFETYMLEEEKTQLTAKLVVEVDGKEGQTLTREVVKNETTGQNTVKIVVVGENGEEIITEIQGQIGQIQNQIAERVVKIDMAGQLDKTDLENGVYIAKEGGSGDDGLKPEVKTAVAGNGTLKNDPLPTSDLNKINPDLYDPNARALGDSAEGGERTYAEGTTADGANGPDPGSEGTNNVVVTGNVVASKGKESFLGRFFKRIFGK